MLYLYLDESGDLGFDFVNHKPSNHFTIAILSVKGSENNMKLLKGIEKTIKRKLRRKKKPKTSLVYELKGREVAFSIKKYFYSQIQDISFDIYAMTLDKRKAYEELSYDKDRVYDWVTRHIVDQIPVESATTSIQMYVDKSKSRDAIKEFDKYITRNIRARISPKILLNIDHVNSISNKGIQAVDLFAWGIFKKYESDDETWLNVYKEKIKFEEEYR